MSTTTTLSALPDLRGYWLGLARAVWVLLAVLAIGLFVLGTAANYERFRAPCSEFPLEDQPKCLPTEIALYELGLTWDEVALFYTMIATAAALPWILIGCLVFWRKSRTTAGLLFSLALVIIGSTLINRTLLRSLLHELPNFEVPVVLLGFLSNVAAIMFLYLFPDGRFVPAWTRWTLMLWVGRTIYGSIAELFSPSFLHALWKRFFDPPLVILIMTTVIYAMIFRYRHDAGPSQRHQIKWVIVALIIVGIFEIGLNILLSFWQPGLYEVILTLVYFPLYYLGALFAAVCIGISISRYRLWNIDFLINRTLVYSLLTAVIVSIYIIVVGVLGTTIQGRSNLLVSILATGLVAVLVQPLRDRLQRGMNRLMYGDRDDPVTVLSRLGERLEATIAPDAVLPALVETVAQTLKLPYAAITCGAGVHGNVAAAYGDPTDHLVQLPLLYQGEIIGQLVVSLRSPGEEFSPADDHLLKNIAHQAGMAVHAVSLTADLQHSRQRLVTAREEERRRLRRDLHDGLGPNLASQGLKLAAVKQLLGNDPASAVAVLEQVITQNQSTVEEVRRLVYGLRPPALDELGLVAAIRDYVAGMDKKSTLHIEILESKGGLPSLPAAVEVAAYRIVLEALTNVIRHAQAKHCKVQFIFDQKENHPALEIEIRDDGIGLSLDRQSGVGTRSMRERAEEVGGTFKIESLMQGGTRVRVWVPLVVV